MSKRIVAILMLVMLVATLAAGCKKKRKPLEEDEDGGSGARRATTPYQSKSDEGTIMGTVSFEGPVPTAPPLDPSGDAVCASTMSEKVFDFYKVKDGKLADVLVYLTGNNIETFNFPVSMATDERVLDQRGCRYVPRAVGLMAGQPLIIRNSDGTNHNVHPRPKNNTGFNESQPARSADIVKTFNTPEERIPVKCDLHPWMTANIYVFNHPCSGVSLEDGTYTIRNVPPGNYQMVFWHERLGQVQVPVTVAAKESKTQNVVFRQGGGSAAPAMKVAEPLVLPHMN
jgi:hypothetical protein